jgi:hypothetical protein
VGHIYPGSVGRIGACINSALSSVVDHVCTARIVAGLSCPFPFPPTDSPGRRRLPSAFVDVIVQALSICFSSYPHRFHAPYRHPLDLEPLLQFPNLKRTRLRFPQVHLERTFFVSLTNILTHLMHRGTRSQRSRMGLNTLQHTHMRKIFSAPRSCLQTTRAASLAPYTLLL